MSLTEWQKRRQAVEVAKGNKPKPKVKKSDKPKTDK